MKRKYFTLPGGRHLSWYEVGQGRPLVLLHGWAASAAFFAELAPLLSSDFRLLIPDLPGHGNSSPPKQAGLARIADDLVSWIETIEQSPVLLAGWSLGGMLALEIARYRVGLVDRLILIGSTPRFTRADDWPCGLPLAKVLALARNLQRNFETTLADFFSLAFAGEDISPERMRSIRNFAVRNSSLPNREAALAFLNELAALDQRALLPEIYHPAMVMHGALDQISPVAAGRHMAKSLPQGELVEYPRVGHGLFLSRPQDSAARIREFCCRALKGF